MVTSGPLSPGTCATDGSGKEWVTPDNAKTANNTYTTVTINKLEIWATSFLVTTDYGFAIPAGATIDGIKVEVERKRKSVVGGLVSDLSIMLQYGGAGVGDEKSVGAAWSTVESYIAYGGAADKWGYAWTAAKINDASFGFAIAADIIGGTSATEIAYIDHIMITVYYTEAAVSYCSVIYIQQ